MIGNIVENGFARPETLESFMVVNSFEELKERCGL